MRAFDELPVRRDNTLDERRMVGWGYFAISRQAAKIVHPFKNDEPADACRSEDVAIET